PFGLGIRDGTVYVGGVCDASNGGTAADLVAYVYSYTIAGGFSASPVLTFPLNYNRECADTGYSQTTMPFCGQDNSNSPTRGPDADWRPWSDNINVIVNNASYGFQSLSPADAGYGSYPMPMLTDIVFDGEDMIIALRDRTGDMLGHEDPGPTESNPTGTDIIEIASGDILRASPNGSGGWTIENNAQSNPAGIFGPAGTTLPGGKVLGAGGNEGPGGGEFYWNDRYDPNHDETSFGSLAQAAGFDEVVYSAMDPVLGGPIFSGGMRQLSHVDDHPDIAGTNNDGDYVRAQVLYDPTNNGSLPGRTFGKAAGMGDIELMLLPAPIEIGNRVWRDDNGNGIQDPNEPPLAGVMVELWQGSTLVGVAVTDANGEYYFGGAGRVNMLPSSVGSVNVLVSASSDDATQNTVNGNTNLTATSLGMPSSTGTTPNQAIGLRFNNVPIPPGAEISSAFIQFTASASDSGTVNLTVRGEAADYPGTFLAGTGNFNIEGRTPTAAAVSWTPAAWTSGSRWLAERTPSLVPIVQEIVNRTAWASGGSMVFVISNNGTTGANRRQAASWDAAGTGNEPELVVGYITRYAIEPNTAYEVRIPNAAGSSQQAPLSGLSLTTPDAAQPANGNLPATDNNPITDVADSDAVLNGNDAVIAFTTGGAGVNNHGLDFGFALRGSIGNYVWLDENSDGYQDAGERGIPNVRVDLRDCTTGNILATTYTDAHGGYLFSGLAAGTYCVDVDESTLPPGMTQTPYTLPGADFGNQNQSGNGYQVVLPPGGENLTADFGYNFNPTACVNDPTDPACTDGSGAIGDRVWIDGDGDGAQDPNEVGIPGVCVELVTAGPDGLFGTADDVVAATTNTDATGYYLFDGLAPGAYVVRMCASNFVPGGALDGYTQTGDPDYYGLPLPPGQGDGRTTAPVVLAPGDVFVNADFGYRPLVCGQIGDTVWFDADADGSGPALPPVIGGAPENQGNGLQNDSAETGIPGVTVALIQDRNANGQWDAGEPIIGTATTDAAGQYLFPCLPIADGVGTDDYLVWVNDTDNVLGGKRPTYDRDGGVAPTASGAPVGVLSAAVLGISAVADLGTTPVMDQDFGYTAPGQTSVLGLIGDRVWLDVDSDGVQDPGEPGLEGVRVELRDASNNLLAVTYTDENGNYYFGGLPPGTYTVVVTPPAGLAQTYDADDGTGPFATPHQSTVTIGAGGINLDQDFGYVGVGTVGNLVWEDGNADGLWQPSEAGIGGVTLDLYWDLNGNGQVDPGEPRVGTTTTDAAGSYLFRGLPVDDGGGDAQFVVVVTDVAGVLAGYWHSLGRPGVDNNSQADPYGVTLTPTAPSDLTADFGYYVRAACLGNFVWLDGNGNGIQDLGEPGINGVRVVLTAQYAGGVSYALATLSGDDPSTAAVEVGWYGYCNLLLDEDQRASTTGTPTVGAPVYTLSAVTPPGYTPTLVNAPGSTPMDDSDNHAGVDGLATQGQVNIVQNANPNAETAPIAGYDFGYQQVLDYGDLPDGPYPTLLANNGARHAIVSGAAHLGPVAPDAEPDGQPTAAANGDDLNGVDDEDGVTFLTPLMPGTLANIRVVITDPDGTACLSAFVDFNGDGVLDPVTYAAIDSVPGSGTVGDLALSSGPHVLTIVVPVTTVGTTPARFRVTDQCGQSGNSATGLALNGEVEDYILAQLGDRMWIDLDGDGQQDPGEPPLVVGTVRLLDSSGNPVVDALGNPITTVTDVNGNYSFPGLPPGTYIVEFVPPPGFAFTAPNVGPAATDSDADQVTGWTAPVTVGAGQVDLTVDAGVLEVTGVAIGNLVFCDLNGNGIFDPGDSGQAGVTVRLYSLGLDNTPYTGDDVLVASTVTNALGFYLFLPVAPGQYYAAVVAATVPGPC
ncbi:MAG: SdrD B-like domain-containing protein, partial [Armatimonadota bacterium]|nr:SdrD B-like domain-containing protein [Armatimonadota bacterium]